jgi:hypothetical protein
VIGPVPNLGQMIEHGAFQRPGLVVKLELGHA